MTHFFTRAILDPSAPEKSIRPLLNPGNSDAAFDAHHRLVWALFPGDDAKRDFLWRSDSTGSFLILSARRPVQSGLFRPLESREFSPCLSKGDRLAFLLRANATIDRGARDGETTRKENSWIPQRNRRVDIVMHALRDIREAEKKAGRSGDVYADQRAQVADSVGRKWLVNQGASRGFDVKGVAVENYSVRKLGRSRGKRATFGLLDMKGVISVSDPETFLAALTVGFGRAKAYGCGLMLLRRA